MKKYAIGQRWVSQTEPELGIGIIKDITLRVVIINFSTSDITADW